MALHPRLRAPVAALAVVTIAATAAYAALPQQSGNVDLANQANLVVLGATGDQLGHGGAPVGDVNGDGIGDYILPAEGSNRAYVIFGRADQGTIDVANLGS